MKRSFDFYYCFVFFHLRKFARVFMLKDTSYT